MKKLLLASIFALIPCFSAFADSTISSKDWTVQSTTINGYPACQLIDHQSADAQTVLTASAQGIVTFMISDNNWNVLSSDIVSIQMDNNAVGAYESSPVVVDSNDFGFDIDKDVASDFLNDYVNSKTMTITDVTTGNVYTIPMITDDLAFSTMVNCVDKIQPNSSNTNQPNM